MKKLEIARPGDQQQQQHQPRRRFRSFAIVAIAVGFAAALRWVLARVHVHADPFIAFYPAIVLVTLYEGPLLGTLAGALSTVAGLLLLHAPIRAAALPDAADLLRVVPFLEIAILVVWICGRIYVNQRSALSALQKSRSSEQHLQDVLREQTEAELALRTSEAGYRHQMEEALAGVCKVEEERADLLAREQRARAEAEAANRRKDQFLAVLSHELRTPLTPVLARLALMKRDPALGCSLRDGLEVIRRNVEMEARLIDDLLDMTRLARRQLKLQMEIVDVHDKVRAALAIYETDLCARNQTIALDLRAENHFVHGDGVRLQQIFWNLIGNAVKYTAQGGHITIRSENVAPAAASDSPEMVRIEVSDDGIGIAPEVMGRIFDPFEQGEQTLTRRYGGLGLGLSISRSLVERHGGTLVAKSAGKGMGSTFTVELAIAPSPVERPHNESPREMKQTQAQSANAAPLAQYPPRRILLVDDNIDTLRVMARLLRMNGHHVLTADSIVSALAEARQPLLVDLLITDIGLPDGTGWELMRQLRQRGLRLGIAVSGFSTDEDYRRSREAGFAEHLCKPINPEDLELAIQRACAVADDVTEPVIV